MNGLGSFILCPLGTGTVTGSGSGFKLFRFSGFGSD